MLKKKLRITTANTLENSSVLFFAKTTASHHEAPGRTKRRAHKNDPDYLPFIVDENIYAGPRTSDLGYRVSPAVPTAAISCRSLVPCQNGKNGTLIVSSCPSLRSSGYLSIRMSQILREKLRAQSTCETMSSAIITRRSRGQNLYWTFPSAAVEQLFFPCSEAAASEFQGLICLYNRRMPLVSHDGSLIGRQPPALVAG
ncbi:hypothetical protein EVAR_29998_1 [Eumeta japonica]|uniref:Uncharacterized protein n=1 Tax=Eumeta variegata TaxID=151549 RepID=A0A4C1VX02_EUMVA|nr:hypothetical protein EVAR_29998_1 [Eumeta japonica]